MAKGSESDEADVTEGVEEVLADDDVADASDCCCICINMPRIILDRLGLLVPVRPPSLAAVVSVDVLEVELETAELVDDAEVASRRDRRLASIWDAFPLVEPIPAMDIMFSF